MKTSGMMSKELLADLEKLIAGLNAHDGPWGKWKGGEKTETGAIQFPYVVEVPIVSEARRFLTDNKLSITFDWPNWQEGRDFFKSEDPDKFNKLDQETVLKLLTAVMRNARFNEGAWVNLFENGDGQKLYMRLLELNKPD